MRLHHGALSAVLGTLALVALAAAQQAPAGQGAASIFPHEKHARVFPVCEGCHAGIVTGDAATAFPTEADCQRCHDGTRVKRIEWRPRAPRASNLQFTHLRHRQVADVAGDSLTCSTCHAATDPPQRMVVRGPNPENCVGCHAHRGEQHITPQAACRTCHIPIANATSLTIDRIAAFPRPDWHGASDFIHVHGRVEGRQAESCAICHARETCERCHANGDRVPLIRQLARDSRVAALQVGKVANYDPPANHGSTDWKLLHGRAALPDGQSCANCHTQASCGNCHVGGTGTSRTAINGLPVGRPGLGVPASRLEQVHPADIIKRHGTLAASGALQCAQCHSEQVCASCHAAQESRRFHVDDFVERHAVEVFTAGADCQSCHNTERFCRECHASVGIASNGRMNAAFHTGKANWVLSHGQAARTGMESCAACHHQNDCIRCHSAIGGWGVSPHGRGFQASARSSANSASCRWCHIGPLPGGGR